jgi:Ca2+-binding RTX toxin-like protein
MRTLYVVATDPNDQQPADGISTFSNLQDAVDAANDGDTIKLAAGMIDLEAETDGHIDIRKSLIIEGDAAGSTLFAENSTDKGMIGVVGDDTNVTFRNFTIDGRDGGLTSGVNVFSGITFINASSGTIDNMTIRNIGEDSPGGGSGRGVFLLDSSKVTITGTAFSENERDDVRVAQSATATIINSTFTAKTDLTGSTPEQTREYGVRADGTSTVTVSDSRFTGYVSVDPLQPSAAIRGTQNATITVSNSTFTDNLNAILIGAVLSDKVALTLAGVIDVTSKLPDAVAVRGQGDGAFTGADHITGDHSTVIFVGGNQPNTIHGGIGNDQLAGGAGADHLSGEGGNDLLAGGLHNDVLNGGEGVDTADYSAASGAVTVNLATGKSSGADGIDTLMFMENVRGSIYADTLTGDGEANVLNGAAGADKINGGGGADTMIGGAGNDTYYVDAFDFVAEVLKEGTDTVNASVGATGTYTLRPNFENLNLTDGAEGIGNDLANTITGNAAANRLLGLDNNDKLLGLAGADVLIGGKGADTLTGGTQGDMFRFLALSDSTTTGRDIITDFQRGQDRIDLFSLDANGATTANDTFKFIGKNAFGGTAGELRYVTDGTNAVVYADVDGNRVADFAITLNKVTALSAGDFVL